MAVERMAKLQGTQKGFLDHLACAVSIAYESQNPVKETVIMARNDLVEIERWARFIEKIGGFYGRTRRRSLHPLAPVLVWGTPRECMQEKL
ncbi:MAG TPA: hypothetical protein VFE62_14120 [Gemmataceae bacterium]|nr:hypothetical protein [Gemmataceae bacterium]